MKSYKALLNSLSDDPRLRRLSDVEISKLRATFLEAFRDLEICCKKYHIRMMLIGGTAIGAVRHKGFIPWDDDLDVAILREDFERLKRVFKRELGDKYLLSAPNYDNNANNRFPMMLVKDTLFVEAGNSPDDPVSKIKIDIFIIENIPKNRFVRFIKGVWCSALMAAGSYEETYEKQNDFFREYMCKTLEGKRAYRKRVFIGRICSFYSFQQWMNIIDRACQYDKKTALMGIPTGRGHYFGEICPRRVFVPVSRGTFEGLTVNLPGNPDYYLRNLYGPDYMTPPPVERRERHFIVDIKFKGEL